MRAPEATTTGEGAASAAACAALLAELGQAGEALAGAAARGDVIAAIAASQEARRLRAEIARHPLPDLGVAGDDGAADVVALRALVAAGRTAASIVDAWRARPLPPARALLGSPLGVACFVDGLLPTTWDPTRDLAVLVGDGLHDVAGMLADLGQARILVVAPPEAAAAYPPAITVVADAEEAGRVVRSMTPCPPERVVVRAIDGEQPELTQEVADAVHTALCDLRVHHNTVQSFSATWLDQGIANLEAIARWPSVAAVGDGLAGVPMIICAPGPSLAKNIELVRAARGRAVVVAVSHSLRPLRAAGVVPDLVITVDPQDVRYHFREGDLDGVGALVNGATVHPALWALGAPRYLSMASNGLLDHWLYQGLDGVADVPGGGSVATSAMALGLFWRCDPIVTVGLDLSFPGGRYYVETSCDGGAHAVVDGDGKVRVDGWSSGFQAMKAAGGPAAARDRVIELPGWHGGTVPSSFMFSMFHRWFVDTARRAGATTRLYNCTEGGAYIDGMTHVPLAEVLAGLDRPVDVAAALDRACAAIDPEARLAQAQRWRDRTVRELGRAVRLARVGAALAARRDAAAARRLPRVERALAAVLAGHDFVAMLAQREIDAAFDEARRPASEDDYLRATERLMRAAERTARRVRDAFARRGASHG